MMGFIAFYPSYDLKPSPEGEGWVRGNNVKPRRLV